MTIKTFKKKFLKEHPINQRAVIANIEWTLKTGKTSKGTLMKESDRKPTEKLLEWCKSSMQSQPDLSFLNSNPG